MRVRPLRFCCMLRMTHLIVPGIWVSTLLLLVMLLVLLAIAALLAALVSPASLVSTTAAQCRLGFAVLYAQNHEEVLGQLLCTSDLILCRCPISQ